MALISVPQKFEGNVLKHVRGCFRSSVQKWITEQKCELRPSKKHGLGLFATRDILPYELITLYPADGVRPWLQDGARTVYIKEFQGMSVDYSAEIPTYKGWRMEIVGDPNQISDPFHLGHMANDYCQMTRVEMKDIYTKISLEGMNADISCVPFEACFREHLWKAHGVWCMKPIKAGEEIYVHYGEDYWITKAEWEAKLSSTVVELNCMD